MQQSKESRTYIAELRIPTFFHSSREVRATLVNMDDYEVTKGYWVLRPTAAEMDLNAEIAFILIVEFNKVTLRDAEDHALRVGKEFSSLVSAYAGQPVAEPLLHRIASADAQGHLVTQTNYSYQRKSHKLAVFNSLVQCGLEKYLQSVFSFDNKTRYRLRTAASWYGISLGANDPAVGVVAAWTGLECVGPLLFNKYHPKDEGKAKNNVNNPCGTCGYEGSRKRLDRGYAGIQHAFLSLSEEYLTNSLSEETCAVVSDELMDDLSADKARCLRNKIVHALEIPGIDNPVQWCREVQRHLYVA